MKEDKSPAGQVIPPMVVFSGKNFNHSLSEEEVPSTFYRLSDSGRMGQELFAYWFSCHFLEHAVSTRSLMLILDGHSSHFTLDLVQTAAEHQVIIILFCLPLHTAADSHTSCFGPLKTYWSQVCQTTRLLILMESSQSFSFPIYLSKHGQKG